MELDAWHIVDVTAWEVFSHNTAGRREKQWLKDPAEQLWLRKTPRVSRPTEPAIEAFTSRLARFVGLAAPETHVAITDSRRWTLVRSFLEDGGERGRDELVHGSVLLQRQDQRYDPEDRALHRLDSVSTVLAAHQVDRVAFLAMLAFDLWVGNSDRHQENWGLIVSASGSRLAPAYDTAACLGAELGDPQLAKCLASKDLRRKYIARCPSGFGDGKKLASLAQVLDEVRARPHMGRPVRRCTPRCEALS